MLYALDLTNRQTKRVLEQALRSNARFQIEARNAPDGPPLSGRLVSIDGNLMTVELDDDGRARPTPTLVGVFCDVQTVLSDQIYLFCTCIMDVIEAGPPRRIVLAIPDSVQVWNRRKFLRRTLARSARVELSTEDMQEPCSAELSNLSGNGLACRVNKDLDGTLLIGEPARARFSLPGIPEQFDLPSVICNKTTTGDGGSLIVGLEFEMDELSEPELDLIERLRAYLCESPTPITDTEAGR